MHDCRTVNAELDFYGAEIEVESFAHHKHEAQKAKKWQAIRPMVRSIRGRMCLLRDNTNKVLNPELQLENWKG